MLNPSRGLNQTQPEGAIFFNISRREKAFVSQTKGLTLPTIFFGVYKHYITQKYFKYVYFEYIWIPDLNRDIFGKYSISSAVVAAAQ